MNNKEQNNSKEFDQGRYSYDNLSRIFHEKARLGIMTSLLTNPKGLTFKELKELCSLTDGNLSRHIQALEENELILVLKSFEGKKPKTEFKLTEKGKEEFLKYFNELENVIKDVNNAIINNNNRNLNHQR